LNPEDLIVKPCRNQFNQELKMEPIKPLNLEREKLPRDLYNYI
jgi:hypothetical protein